MDLTMERRRNNRGFTEHFVRGRHLKLEDLKKVVEAEDLKNKWIFKLRIPAYPQPEFHVSHLKHDTDTNGLKGIKSDGGFRSQRSLQWWSLAVRPEDVRAAETRLLEKTFPDRTEEQAQNQQSFLGKFATSPAFLETSRLGSYRFTFPVAEVLKAYSEQFCSGREPVMHVFKTVLYKKEVMYVVLVDSPGNQSYPLLNADPDGVCVYRDGCFTWRPEAMCETHRYGLVKKPGENLMVTKSTPPKFYLWDNVTIALHVKEGQVLRFDARRLRENLTFCEPGKPTITKTSDTFQEAEEVVKRLWPDYPAHLEKERSLQD